MSPARPQIQERGGTIVPGPRLCRQPYVLPATEELLISGGDSRIAVAPGQQTNRYGCGPRPDPSLAAFGSSTASVISESAFAAAVDLRRAMAANLRYAPPGAVYEHEADRIRRELLDLCDLAGPAAPDVILGQSGTDLHAVAVHLLPGPGRLIIMVDPNETGSGVTAALNPRLGTTTLASVRLRNADGTPRAPGDIDREVEDLAGRAVARGLKVLIVMVDVSKTGLIAPSPGCVAALHRHLSGALDILVDACQFRLAPQTLRNYLDAGFLVAVTGSKFVTGPTFSGALLVPRSAAGRLASQVLAPGHALGLLRGDVPPHWRAADSLPSAANFGLLLRWRAALTELRAFRAIPDTAVTGFLTTFSQAVTSRLEDNPAFLPLPSGPLQRATSGHDTAWDSIPTIFPFLLRRRMSGGQRQLLDRCQSRTVHQLLLQPTGIDFDGHPGPAQRRQLGQPVACGIRDGIAISALRLCASARLVVAATRDHGAEAVIASAMDTLDQAATIATGRPR